MAYMTKYGYPLEFLEGVPLQIYTIKQKDCALQYFNLAIYPGNGVIGADRQEYVTSTLKRTSQLLFTNQLRHITRPNKWNNMIIVQVRGNYQGVYFNATGLVNMKNQEIYISLPPDVQLLN